MTNGSSLGRGQGAEYTGAHQAVTQTEKPSARDATRLPLRNGLFRTRVTNSNAREGQAGTEGGDELPHHGLSDHVLLTQTRDFSVLITKSCFLPFDITKKHTLSLFFFP